MEKANSTQKIFLLGLDPEFKKEELVNFFKIDFPSVTHCCLIKSKKHKKTNNIGYGTLFLQSKEEAKKILKKRKFTLKKRTFVVKPYYKGNELKKFKSSVQRRRVYVNQIPPSMENQNLRRVFQDYGDVEDAYVVRNQRIDGFRKFGYVIFEKEEDAQKVVRLGCIEFGEDKIGVKEYKNSINEKNKKKKKKSKKNQKQKKKIVEKSGMKKSSEEKKMQHSQDIENIEVTQATGYQRTPGNELLQDILFSNNNGVSSPQRNIFNPQFGIKGYCDSYHSGKRGYYPHNFDGRIDDEDVIGRSFYERLEQIVQRLDHRSSNLRLN